ncbi:putative cation/H+ exchanger [Medicago truncatula]|uniref:Cation/H+ exchanger 3 n=1 Tax=Medicago truncatula TaxID=3880 RepID=G7K7R5_MEDTR|nr:cation/H+ exchanger 3 [Medicago truncatula]RHN57499.1 putative cation/H+ exchanger [Medicago truncatula]
MSINSNYTLFNEIKRLNGPIYKVCFEAPPHIVSDGLWGGHDNGRRPMKSFLTLFELQLIIIFALTQICSFLLKPLRLPQFLPQMIAGLILGVSFELKPMDTYMDKLFPYGTHDVISSISSLGMMFFVFINGVQMDFSLITRTGKKAWIISIIGFSVPLCVLFIPLLTLPGKVEAIQKIDGGNGILVAMLTHSLSTFGTIASLLSELQIQNSELGRLSLSSALVCDILTAIIQSNIVVLVTSPDSTTLLRNLFLLYILIVLIPLVCRPIMFWIIKRTPEGRPVKDSYLYVIISMVFVFGILSVKINQEFAIGAFILGLSVPEGPPLGSALVKKLQFFCTTFFLPIFVTTCVLKADFSMDVSSSVMVYTGLAVLVTHLVKMTACFITALCCKMPVTDALCISLILNTKGVIEVGIYSSAFDDQIINRKTFGMMMISIMIIATIVHWSVKLLYDPSRKYAGYQKRNMMGLKRNSELRILVTLQKQNHISAATNFLDLCCPTQEKPITVDVLHVIELVGRALPLFIHHRLQRQASGSTSSKSYSDNVILAFDIYEHDNQNAVSINTYTAISPPNLMFEDVCNLALDKVATIIILPFHIRWSSDGEVESDDKKVLRALNRRVLEIAPCSVGILVTRANSMQKPTSIKSEYSTTRLAIIYLGGNDDDEEVLCLAKRAMNNPKINLVVYRLIAKENIEELEEFMVIGDEMLEEFKHAENVRYQEVFTKNGSQTASFLREIVNEHDFFIVGRRHETQSPQTDGLAEWSEFPELGAIGDFLASPDLNSSASVLVVQQQLSRTNDLKGWIL